MMTCINVAEFILISWLEKDHCIIETRRLKNVVIFNQAILSFVLSGNITQSKSTLKRTISWNSYLSKPELLP